MILAHYRRVLYRKKTELHQLDLNAGGSGGEGGSREEGKEGGQEEREWMKHT